MSVATTSPAPVSQTNGSPRAASGVLRPPVRYREAAAESVEGRPPAGF